MITNIIFDFGGVLFPVQPHPDVSSLDPKAFQNIKQQVIDIYDENLISPEYLKANLHDPQIVKSLTTIDDQLFTFIKQHAKKYSLYGLVNEAPKWTDIRIKLFDLGKYFQDIFVSSDIGYEKPNPNAYRYFLDHAKCNPASCLFVDDNPTNVGTAWLMGMEGCTYRNIHSLTHALRK